jgi:1-acyl-sn-glycerol-3-phosphate acyltransferase
MSAEVESHSRFFLRVGFPVCRALAAVVLTLLGPYRTTGKYRVPKQGGLLILSNHISDIDPVLVQVACPRDIYFMAKSELFGVPVLGGFLRWFCAFPVKRGEPDRAALKLAVEHLKSGHTVCVFPEGELSESGELQQLKAGVALIARMSGAMTICVGLRNTNRVTPYGTLIPRPAFRMLEARWGEPRSFDRHVEPEEFLGWAEGQLRELTDQER